MMLPKSKQSNESIKVCIRVRPLLQHELMKEEIIYYPESKDPSLQVSSKIKNFSNCLFEYREFELLTVSIWLSLSTIEYSTSIANNLNFLNLPKITLMMFLKGSILLFLHMDRQAQERLIPCLVLTGMTIMDTRILWPAWDPVSAVALLAEARCSSLTRDNSVWFQGPLSTYSKDLQEFRMKVAWAILYIAHFYKSTMKNYLISSKIGNHQRH